MLTSQCLCSTITKIVNPRALALKACMASSLLYRVLCPLQDVLLLGHSNLTDMDLGQCLKERLRILILFHNSKNESFIIEKPLPKMLGRWMCNQSCTLISGDTYGAWIGIPSESHPCRFKWKYPYVHSNFSNYSGHWLEKFSSACDRLSAVGGQSTTTPWRQRTPPRALGRSWMNGKRHH